MGQLMFSLAAVAACLLWSAAFVAAAARTDRTWLRRLLVAVALVVPLLAVAPWVLLTAALAFRVGLETNWFAPTLTAFVSVLVGGLWLCRAGLAWSPAASRLVAAADGDGAAAVADLIRMHRLGMHAASEPLLLSGLVGKAIDETAIGTLADVLPRLEKDDLPLLHTDAVRDFVATPIRYQGGFLGEEACGLAMLGDLTDEVDGSKMLEWLRSERVSDAWTRFMFDRPFTTDATLRSKTTDDAWVVYSVGLRMAIAP